MRILFAVTTSLALTACATAYQAESFTGGFSETQLDKNVFWVSFRGNGYTRPDRVEEMALLRSAEITLKNGFTHFVIVESTSGSHLSAFTTPAQSYTTRSATAFGNTAYGSAKTTTYGGQTFVISKPRVTNTIVCFDGKPDIPGVVFDAQFLYNSLGQKYRVVGASSN